jgi:hypothetical protein
MLFLMAGSVLIPVRALVMSVTWLGVIFGELTPAAGEGKSRNRQSRWVRTRRHRRLHGRR